MVVEHAHRRHLTEARTLERERRGIEYRVISVFDIACREFAAVAEADAAAQMKDERGRRRALDAFGKVVDVDAAAVDADHRVVDEFVETRGNRVAREARIERR